VIITRTPLRVSIGGGGTDLPSYYAQRGGFVVAAAIDRYMYVSANRTFTDDYFLKYSAIERVSSVDEIQHPLIREALRRHDAGPSLELVSVADIPAGTGLGSSGTFTVGLLRALYAMKREPVTTQALAEEACHIEMEILGQPVGKQDQYIAAYGGLTVFDISRDGSVDVTPLAVGSDTIADLETHLVLFFTGYSREASTILAEQKTRSEANDPNMLAALDRVKELGHEIKRTLEDGDTVGYAKLMHEHWEAKRLRSQGMSNPKIDRWYEMARANGAIGGKLVGAGAGGFLLLYADDPARIRRVLNAEGLTEVRIRFDHDGSVVLARG
jgi:D-glycero-alpha-D-manno-heptose-7-phosphate kinase